MRSLLNSGENIKSSDFKNLQTSQTICKTVIFLISKHLDYIEVKEALFKVAFVVIVDGNQIFKSLAPNTPKPSVVLFLCSAGFLESNSNTVVWLFSTLQAFMNSSPFFTIDLAVTRGEGQRRPGCLPMLIFPEARSLGTCCCCHCPSCHLYLRYAWLLRWCCRAELRPSGQNAQHFTH